MNHAPVENVEDLSHGELLAHMFIYRTTDGPPEQRAYAAQVGQEYTRRQYLDVNGFRQFWQDYRG